MPPESNTNINNQQAEKIVNVGTNIGGINVQSATIYNNVTSEPKPSSRVLTRKLIEAIKDYSPKATIFLGKIAESEKANWEMRVDNKYLSTAKDTIVSSYASVLGVFISNLFGCENTSDYFALSNTVARRSLQLLNFSFLSALQGYLKDGTHQLIDKPPDILKKFFETQNELDLSQYSALFSELIAIFKKQQFEYPIPEINGREDGFKEGSVFFEACSKLNAFATSSTGNLPSVNEIENLLTDFLVSLNFLAAYKMISIKDISYEEVWHRDDVNTTRYKNRAQYLYCYTFLGINKDAGKRYNYADKPLNTEAVLLFRNTYKEGISIFPFVIDYNTLIDEQPVNICFFTCYEDEIDDSTDDVRKIIRYFESNKTSSGVDDNDIIIRFDEDVENALSAPSNQDIITRFKIEDNSNKFKAKKKNEVFKAFNQIKATVMGVV